MIMSCICCQSEVETTCTRMRGELYPPALVICHECFARYAFGREQDAPSKPIGARIDDVVSVAVESWRKDGAR